MRELIDLAFGALHAQKLRSALSLTGIAIGIAAVILLTSIGEGTRRYVLSQFTQFGTNLMAINPGKSKTVGIPGVLGGTTHKLTIDDAEAIKRLPGVTDIVSLAVGTARVQADGRGRSVYIYGVTPRMPEVWRIAVRTGAFWTESDPHQGAPVAVLGPKLKREVFGDQNALGRFVRIADTRFRVIGVMEPKGRFLGFDLDDTVYIPVARALKLFDLTELNEIDVRFSNDSLSSQVEKEIRRLLMARHGGNEDFTITTQDAMLRVLGNVLNVITMAVGAIGGISLIVGAIGILTVMWIAVGERTEEIGLLRAIGATQGQVQMLFLAESAALAAFGGAAGLTAGVGFCAVLRALVPGLPIHTPLSFAVAAIAVSALTGLGAGVLPARRAARLDPITALRSE